MVFQRHWAVRLILVGLMGTVVLTGTGDLQAQPAEIRSNPREDEALDLIVTVVGADSLEEQIAGVRKLAAFRYPTVALALVQIAEEPELHAQLSRELEWALVALSELAVEPLADALANDRVSRDFASILLRRIARQELDFVAPLLQHDHPAVARAAGLAVALCGHPDADQKISDSFEDAAPAARQALLEATCHRYPLKCPELVKLTFSDANPEVRILAIDLSRREALKDNRARVISCLHDPHPGVARAALEALTFQGLQGLEKDLEIMLKSSPPDMREDVLRSLAILRTKAARKVIRQFARDHGDRTSLGRLARTLLNAGKEP
jgi:hypothetical protein